MSDSEGSFIGAVPARPLTSEDSAFLVVGDLHLHLQASGLLDRFQLKQGEDIINLDGELRNLMDVSKKCGLGVTTVQIGDMYEAWETECILRYRLLPGGNLSAL
jgi:hypothetical protein